MTLLGIYIDVVDIEEIPFTPLVQLSCVGCKNFLNNYTCPLYTPHVSAFRSYIMKKFRKALIVVAWFDLASRVVRLVSKGKSIVQALTLAQLQVEGYSRRVLPKVRDRVLRRLRELNVVDLYVTHFGGGCNRCKPCNATMGKPCRFPNCREFPSPEALGVDVYTLLKKLNIPYEAPPRSYVTKVMLFLVREAPHAVTKEFCQMPRLPNLSTKVTDLIIEKERCDRERLVKVLTHTEKLNIEISPIECKAKHCPFKGSAKCRIVRNYFEKLRGKTATVLAIGGAVDVKWLRQSYMRHIAHLCTVATPHIITDSRRSVQTICTYVLGIDNDTTILITDI